MMYLTLPYNYTMGLVGLISAFGIAYCLAESYQDESSCLWNYCYVYFLNGVQLPLKDGGISTSYLGADGLFVAINNCISISGDFALVVSHRTSHFFSR